MIFLHICVITYGVCALDIAKDILKGGKTVQTKKFLDFGLQSLMD